jgi:hypothetical protein
VGTLVVAILGLVLAIAGLVWQVVSFLMTYITRVRVTLDIALVGGPEPFNAVEVKAINRSAHPVRVTGAYLYLQDKSGGRLALWPRDWLDKLPGVVPPRDAASCYFDIARMQQDRVVDLGKPLVASVVLATDKEIKSEAKVLRPRPLV